MLRIFKIISRKPASRDQENSPPATPTTPSRFLSHLSKHPDKPTRQLLQPYLEYETWLRKIFTTPSFSIGGTGDLVSVYGWRQCSIRIRTTDRNETTMARYIMPLKDEQRLPEGAPAIAASFAEFQYQFEAFTHDWSNLVVAGSAALIPLLPIREDVSPTVSAAVERPEEYYYETIADATVEEAVVRKNQRLDPGEALCLRIKNTVTFIAPRWPFRHIQVVLRLYRSVTEILTGFDIDCACVAFDGRHVYTTPRGATAISTRTNTIDLTRRSPSYEMRLFKYRKQNLDVFWESLDRSRINMDLFEKLREHRDLHPKNVKGLARLILAEIVVSGRRPYTDSLTSRALKKLGDAQDPEFTGPTVYTSVEIPYTKRFTADRVRQFVARHSSIPFLFGTLNEILKGSGSAKPEEKELPGRLGFMKDNPGRQMIGSFYPLDEQGWAEAAYEVIDHLSDCEELSSRSEGTEYRRSEEEDSEEEDSEEEDSEEEDSEEEDSEEQEIEKEDNEEEDSEEQEIEEEDSEEEDSEKQDSKGPENREVTDSSVVEHSNNTDVHRREQ
ncbi:hypothetical protein CBS147353_2016 [Aspergillus niger]|nr:hypothetical protein CBS147353_2016 [Aspergillus niger]